MGLGVGKVGHGRKFFRVILPALNISAPVFKYGGKATATDFLHHAVYATATGLAYSYLERSQSR